MPVKDWQKNASTKDGLQSQCGACQCKAVARGRERKRRAERWATAQLRLAHRDEYNNLVAQRLAGIR